MDRLEKLGFRLVYEDECKFIYAKLFKCEAHETVTLYKKDKTIKHQIYEEHFNDWKPLPISLEVHLAVHQVMKGLGWFRKEKENV